MQVPPENERPEESTERNYLYWNVPKIYDCKRIFDAIAGRWPNITYPAGAPDPTTGKPSSHTNKLYAMFDTVLQTLSGGKPEEFIQGFLDGRTRGELKTNVAGSLNSETMDALHALIQACNDDCKARDSHDAGNNLH